MKKIVGSESGSASISQRHGSALKCHGSGKLEKSGSGMNIQDNFAQSLETFFGVKNT
jgi:hypothetical protein